MAVDRLSAENGTNVTSIKGWSHRTGMSNSRVESNDYQFVATGILLASIEVDR